AGYFLGLALFYCGRTNDAEILLNRFLSSKELADDSLLISVQAIIAAAAGKTDEAEAKIRIAEKGETRFVHSHHVAYGIGSAYALMHRNDDAMTWLRRAVDDGDPCYPFLKSDPNPNSLQGYPAFMKRLDEQLHQLE